MDGATVQARIWRGYAKAADVLGSEYRFYRPAGAAWMSANALNGPLFPNFIRKVSLNAEDMKYGKPNKYGKATWYALLDGTDLHPGDYFVGQQGTFFIAALQPLLPILAVECNRVISICRVPNASSFGAKSYGGMTDANEVPYVTGVPCSILQGTKGEKSDVSLPADTRLPWWSILLPAPATTVLYGDLILDDLGRRYIVSSAELTDLGYRLTAMLAMT